MKVAASNLAWDAADDEDVARLLDGAGAEGVELAPSKVWPRPDEVTEEDAVAVREAWRRRGFAVVALQSLLFTHPHLKLFGTAADRTELGTVVRSVIDLASWLGAHALVFGSPKSRVRGDLSVDEATEIATEFFAGAGAHAESRGTCLCIEPNPPEYGCDFVTNAAEGRALVARVGSPGFGLHLDAGGMTLAGDTAPEVTASVPVLTHFHASEPGLKPVHAAGETPHAAFAGALRDAGYTGWVSLEMLPPAGGPAVVARSVSAIRALYG
ncbi:MAG TPA: sugar phosphate isomerase/epimerase family protein [Actinomycetota bacterium]|nr:sugar phosphate isomerase/epimerase family protein [Actinomycetota bacterium]